MCQARNLRNKDLQQLVGYKHELDADEQHFLNLLTDIINILIHGEEPPEVAVMLSSNEMFAAPKSNEDVRPIGIGCTLRKLAAKACLNVSQAHFNATHFGDLQLAMKRNGIEEIVHMFAESMEKDPSLDVFCADGDNAFNAANRIAGLREVKDHFPAALAHCRDMYLDESTAWYYDNIEPILCRNGYHQGDVLASWLYVMTIQPLLLHIKNEMARLFPNRSCLIKFYVDDGNFTAPFDMMLKIVEILQQNYHRYGYKLKPTKGHYLLGKCQSAEVAQQRFQQLVDIGLHPSIIKIHPDNIGDSQDPETKTYSIKNYGVKMLGAFLGTDDFIRHNLAEYVQELKTCANSLMQYPDLQGRLLMFRYCFMSKPLYLMRTTRPDLMDQFVEELLRLQRSIINSIFNAEITEGLFKVLALRISAGGIGIHYARELLPAAYTASYVAFFRAQGFETRMQQLQQGDCFSPRMDMLRLCLNKFKFADDDPFIPPAPPPGLFQEMVNPNASQLFVSKLRHINSLKSPEDRETLQHILTYNLQDKRMKAAIEVLSNHEESRSSLRWYNGLKNAEAGAWLDAVPKIDKLRMKSSEFRTALRYRYRLPIPAIRAGTRCDCKVTSKQPNGRVMTCHPILDTFGYHVSTGCGKDGHRINTHNMLVMELNNLIRFAGGNTIREETHCFGAHLPDDNHRPDISILNPVALNLPARKALLDVAVTCPLEGAQSGRLVNPSLTEAQRATSKNLTANYKSKLYKYKTITDHCQEADGSFDPAEFSIYPIVFESTGAIHPESLKLIDKIVDKAAEITKFSGTNLVNYFKKRLSVCLQTQIARAINGRVGKLMGRQDFRYDRNFADEIIAEEGQMPT